MFSQERKQQMREALEVLDDAPSANVLYAGARRHAAWYKSTNQHSNMGPMQLLDRPASKVCQAAVASSATACSKSIRHG